MNPYPVSNLNFHPETVVDSDTRSIIKRRAKETTSVMTSSSPLILTYSMAAELKTCQRSLRVLVTRIYMPADEEEVRSTTAASMDDRLDLTGAIPICEQCRLRSCGTGARSDLRLPFSERKSVCVFESERFTSKLHPSVSVRCLSVA